MAANKPTYRQCVLRRGNAVRVTWLPSRYAVVGETVRLRRGDSWDDGWIVAEASSPMPGETVEKMARAHLVQRKASDVVFAKIVAQNQIKEY